MEYPDFRLDGQVALVTGASKGIGRDLAKALSAAGANVAVAARDLSALEHLATEIETAGGRVLPVSMDVRHVESIHNAVNRVHQHFGSLDVLVNNAGLGSNQPAEAVTEEDWDVMMAVNLRGLFF
ncbi:MAG: SDR family oxidoreductase, partial [Gemmatimonadales bacterium]